MIKNLVSCILCMILYLPIFFFVVVVFFLYIMQSWSTCLIQRRSCLEVTIQKCGWIQFHVSAARPCRGAPLPWPVRLWGSVADQDRLWLHCPLVWPQCSSVDSRLWGQPPSLCPTLWGRSGCWVRRGWWRKRAGDSWGERSTVGKIRGGKSRKTSQESQALVCC